jgi:hypothetical protein
MYESLSALPNKVPFLFGAFCVLLSSVFFSSVLSAETVRWFISDGAGIAYESVSRVVALRSEWALEIRVEDSSAADASEVALGFLLKGEQRETKTVYKQGQKRRTSVSFLDPTGFARFSQTVEEDGSLTRCHYDSQKRLIDETSQESDGSGVIVKYKWLGERLSRASAYPLDRQDGDPLWTDTYRYNRSGALRSVSRDPEATEFSHDSHGGSPHFLEFRAADGSRVRTTFNDSGREEETIAFDSDGKTVSSQVHTSYVKAEESGNKRSIRRSEGLADNPTETQYDEKGRAIREVRFGKDGKVVEEIITEWSGDRVSSVTRTRENQIRKSEFFYDGRGNRINEKNYLNGRLERVVRKEGAMEIEELYKNGSLLLRAVYEGGVLVREERLRVPSGVGEQ